MPRLNIRLFHALMAQLSPSRSLSLKKLRKKLLRRFSAHDIGATLKVMRAIRLVRFDGDGWELSEGEVVPARHALVGVEGCVEVCWRPVTYQLRAQEQPLHQRIIQYLEAQQVGKCVSVRVLSTALGVDKKPINRVLYTMLSERIVVLVLATNNRYTWRLQGARPGRQFGVHQPGATIELVEEEEEQPGAPVPLAEVRLELERTDLFIEDEEEEEECKVEMAGEEGFILIGTVKDVVVQEV